MSNEKYREPKEKVYPYPLHDQRQTALLTQFLNHVFDLNLSLEDAKEVKLKYDKYGNQVVAGETEGGERVFSADERSLTLTGFFMSRFIEQHRAEAAKSTIDDHEVFGDTIRNIGYKYAWVLADPMFYGPRSVSLKYDADNKEWFTALEDRTLTPEESNAIRKGTLEYYQKYPFLHFQEGVIDSLVSDSMYPLISGDRGRQIAFQTTRTLYAMAKSPVYMEKVSERCQSPPGEAYFRGAFTDIPKMIASTPQQTIIEEGIKNGNLVVTGNQKEMEEGIVSSMRKSIFELRPYIAENSVAASMLGLVGVDVMLRKQATFEDVAKTSVQTLLLEPERIYEIIKGIGENAFEKSLFVAGEGQVCTSAPDGAEWEKATKEYERREQYFKTLPNFKLAKDLNVLRM